MSDATSAQWLYYRLYAGAAARKMDHLVTGVLPRVTRMDGITGWFFLHYTDERGAHLRLRLRTTGDVTALHRAVEPVLHDALAELSTLPWPARRPAVLPPPSAGAARVSVQHQPDRTGVEIDRYEPDVETFGANGVAVAEELFFASSEAAVRILADERERRYSRKTVAPLLMKATGDAFVPGAGRSTWLEYADYWLDWNPEYGDAWRPRFAAKARALRAQGVPVLVDDDVLPREALRLVSAWRGATTTAAAAFRAVGGRSARPARDLMFHFLHSMNNRLGLMPVEEAYFATLIAEASGMGDAP